MPSRARVRARGAVDCPGHPLHGAKVDLINTAPDGKLVLRLQEPHGTYARGALVMLQPQHFKRQSA